MSILANALSLSSEKIAPWFKLEAKELLSNPAIASLSPAALGVYLRLLLHAWASSMGPHPQACLPADPAVLARLAGVTARAYARTHAELMRPGLELFRHEGDWLVSPFLENSKEYQEEVRAQKRAAGAASAAARANGRPAATQHPFNGRSTGDERAMNNLKTLEINSKTPPTPPEGGVKGGEGRREEERPEGGTVHALAPRAERVARPPRRRRTALTASQRERFSAWWAVYPRQESPGDAETVWAQIDDGTDEFLASLLGGAEAYARHCAATGRAWKMTRTPANWLRARGWESDYGGAGEEKAAEIKYVHMKCPQCGSVSERSTNNPGYCYQCSQKLSLSGRKLV